MRRFGECAVWLTVWVCSLAANAKGWQDLIVAEGATAAPDKKAIAAALQLLPRLPVRVAVIDVSEASPDVRARLARLDAFIVKGSAVVYVVLQSELLARAREGSAFHTHALAAVLWHEMAHVDGVDERAARQREEALWTGFVRDGRVDSISGLRYLTALTRRANDQLQTALRMQ